jgi:epoxyqueuosine reductase
MERSPALLEALASDIKTWGRELGFQKVGITDTDLSAYKDKVRQWLADGFHGEMGYMAEHVERRLDPTLLEPETCRVISARLDYLPEGSDPVRVLDDASRAYVSRYALGRDYHKVVRRRLATLARRIDDAARGCDDVEHGARYRAFTDSAPVLEKALAAKAGLGWIGKHTLLLDRDAGSWFFLGEIYTNLPLPVDEPAQQDHCGKCQACITVCPTRAIVGPRRLDARRCISYLTIEHRGSIPEALRPLMGNRVFGCDDCQIYCPWNRHARHSTETDFRPRHGLDAADLLALFAWSEAEFLERTEGSAIRRASYAQWRRNLAIAIGNGPASEAALAALHGARADPSPLVREHVEWAISRLRERRARTRRNPSDSG